MFYVCLPCAVTRPMTVRQLITHAVMLRGHMVCGCAA